MTQRFLKLTGAATVLLFGAAAIIAGLYDRNNIALWLNAIVGGAIFGRGCGSLRSKPEEGTRQ